MSLKHFVELKLPSFYNTWSANFDGCKFQCMQKRSSLHPTNSSCFSLNQILDFTVSKVLLHKIHELANPSFKSLNIFKTELLCRNENALQITFELFEQISWNCCSKYSAASDSWVFKDECTVGKIWGVTTNGRRLQRSKRKFFGT